MVEVSTDAQTWIAVPPVTGYPGALDPPDGGTSVLAGQPAFVHNSGGLWLPVYVDLSPYVGLTVQLGFHVGWDSNNCDVVGPQDGWFVDDVTVYRGSP